jgi:hypothetical protein
MVEMYGPERMLVNSAGDWGPSKPTAVPDFIFAMRKRGHSEAAIRRIVYDNPLKFFSGSRNFHVPGQAATAKTVGTTSAMAVVTPATTSAHPSLAVLRR